MNRDFKGIWIPREIWLAKDLSCHEKCLWAEIHSLFDRESGGCYASNEYLMEFFGIKERRLQEMMANLKKKGWVVQVSFDGRNRVIKAVVPQEDYKPEEESAGQRCGKVHPRDAEKCGSEGRESAPPTYSIEQSLVTTLDSPPLPPKKSREENAAKAAEVENGKSSKSKREKPEFPPKVREIANLMVNTLHEANPHWLIPTNLHSMMVEIEKMIVEEKREPKVIIDVFMWTVSDSFWMDKLCKPNPAKYLRSQFGQLAGKMNAKVPVNPNQTDRRLKDKEGKSVDEYKDLMF